MTTPVTAPPPPPGPGVMPPFPAPPVEGRTARLWLRLGVAGAAVLLCCGGALTAGIGLIVLGTRAINEQAQIVVTNYLDDVRDGRYSDAYEYLCDRLQERETRRQFADRMSDEPRINDFRVGEAELITEIVLPVDVRYQSGTEQRLTFLLTQDQGTGALEVCGIDG